MTKRPINGLSNLFPGALLYRIVEHEHAPGKKYPALDIITITSFRMNDSLDGVIVEGSPVEELGSKGTEFKIMEDAKMVRDITILKDQSALKFSIGTWTDNREMALGVLADRALFYKKESEIMLKDAQDYNAMIKAILEVNK